MQCIWDTTLSCTLLGVWILVYWTITIRTRLVDRGWTLAGRLRRYWSFYYNLCWLKRFCSDAREIVVSEHYNGDVVQDHYYLGDLRMSLVRTWLLILWQRKPISTFTLAPHEFSYLSPISCMIDVGHLTSGEETKEESFNPLKRALPSCFNLYFTFSLVNFPFR